MYAVFKDTLYINREEDRRIEMVDQHKTLQQARDAVVVACQKYGTTWYDYTDFVANDKATILRINDTTHLHIAKIDITERFMEGTLSVDDEITYKRTYRQHTPLGQGYDDLRETLTKGDLRPALRYLIEYYPNGGSGIVFYLNGFPRNTAQNYH